ncbi:hypothetical protein HPB49_021311 [Dermacentor silvarum]|uniref:Uncharacterized protein n=1 Tax=Dermacentor silvarum TaxID=543639 RepID=A0ACB8DG31_DERSI|nr:hypothetical protein HPB49_021311 [Dermacentor silvarum]
MEDHCSSLPRQQWGQTCDRMAGNLGLRDTWSLLRVLLDPTHNKAPQRKDISHLLHSSPLSDSDFLTALRDRCLCTDPPTPFPAYTGSPNPELDADSSLGEGMAALSPSPLTVSLDGTPLRLVSTLRIFGLFLQSNGKHTTLITRLTNSVHQTIRLIRRIANRHHDMREHHLRRLVQAFVLSHFIYSRLYLFHSRTEKDKVHRVTEVPVAQLVRELSRGAREPVQSAAQLSLCFPSRGRGIQKAPKEAPRPPGTHLTCGLRAGFDPICITEVGSISSRFLCEGSNACFELAIQLVATPAAQEAAASVLKVEEVRVHGGSSLSCLYDTGVRALSREGMGGPGRVPVGGGQGKERLGSKSRPVLVAPVQTGGIEVPNNDQGVTSSGVKGAIKEFREGDARQMRRAIDIKNMNSGATAPRGEHRNHGVIVLEGKIEIDLHRCIRFVDEDTGRRAP